MNLIIRVLKQFLDVAFLLHFFEDRRYLLVSNWVDEFLLNEDFKVEFLLFLVCFAFINTSATTTRVSAKLAFLPRVGWRQAVL